MNRLEEIKERVAQLEQGDWLTSDWVELSRVDVPWLIAEVEAGDKAVGEALREVERLRAKCNKWIRIVYDASGENIDKYLEPEGDVK